MPTDFETVRMDVENGIATLTLQRPEKRNAINDVMRKELSAALGIVEADKAIRALVITGSGRAFCGGGDVQGMMQRLSEPPETLAFNGWTRQQRTHHLVGALHAVSKPTIAAVNGAATGLGCDIALCRDFIIASTAATLAMSYINRGLIPDGGGLYFLPRRVGLVRAKELIFSGRQVKPDEALRIGMIDRVVSPDLLVEEARKWAEQLSQGSAPSLALAKTILNQSFELTLDQIFAMGSQAQAICFTTAEHHQSVSAFLNRSSDKRD